MATQEKTWNVANRLHSQKDSDNPEVNHIIAGADEIYDDEKSEKQSDINAQVDAALADRYTKTETYSKEQLDSLITTPDVNYVSVVATNATTAVTDILPATGEANTIYRVGNWNGTQYDHTMYALFAWNGTTYVCLAVRSFVGEVYDTSVNHPDGQGNPTHYADLAAALGTDGANIPADIRRGGMRIQFVQSSDNKYVQYRLMADAWSTDTDNWSFCGNDVYIENPEWVQVVTDNEGKILYGVKSNSDFYFGAGTPSQVKSSIDKAVNAEEERAMAVESTKVDKEEGESLIEEDFAKNVPSVISMVESPEYMQVETDVDGKVLGGRKLDGTKFENCPIETPAVIMEGIDNPEYLNVVSDKDGKILLGIKKDGSIYWGAGVPKQVVTYVEDRLSQFVPEVNDIYEFKSIKRKFNPGKLLDKAAIGTTIDLTDVEANTANSIGMYLIDECKEGDVYKIKGEADDNWRLVSFVDENLELVYQSENVYMNGVEVVAPSDGYIVVNAKYSSSNYSWYQFDVLKKVSKLESKTTSWKIGGSPIPLTYTPTENSWKSMASGSGNPFTVDSTVADIYSLYDGLVAAYPDYITKVDLGMDASNTYHIYNYIFDPGHINLLNNSFTPDKPIRLLLIGGTHGNGKSGDVNVMKGVLYYFLKDICENYKTNDTLEFFRYNIIFDVIPLINPWGHENVIDTGAFTGSRCNYNGVDINRNSQHYWAPSSPTKEEGGETVHNPTYGGEYPLSEPESMIWFNWVRSHEDAAWFFDIHAIGGASQATQSNMMYGSGLPDDWFYIFQSAGEKISNVWNGLQVGGLDDTILHCTYTDEALPGNPHIAHGISDMGVQSGVFEGFANFKNHAVSVVNYGDEIMHMLQIYMGYMFLYTINYIVNKRD